MIVDGDIIHFKSDIYFWEKERRNAKSNTIRHIPEEEISKYDLDVCGNFLTAGMGDDFTHITNVVIENSQTGEQFEREITDASKIDIGEVEFFVISWNAPLDVERRIPLPKVT